MILSQVPLQHNLDTLLGNSADRMHTFVLWLKLQALAVLPVYAWLMFQPHWTAIKRALVILGDLLAITGTVVCLTISEDQFLGRLQAEYPASDFVDNLAGLSTLILGIWFLALGWDIWHQLRRIRRETTITNIDWVR